jgi:periplasmic protein TonB
MKQLLSFLAAGFLSFFLFFLMHLLIDPEVKAISSSEVELIVIHMDQDEAELNVKSRRKPPKLEQIKPKPELPKTRLQKTQKKPITVAKAIGGITGFNQSFQPNLKGELAIRSSDGSSDSALTPRVRVQPMYPDRAARENKEGFVTLLFDINSSGDPENIRVVESEPRGYFEKSAKRALAKWKYQAKRLNGESVAVLDQSITLAFKLSSD